MKLHVRQYRPAFFEGFDNWEGDVETLEELLCTPFIKRWADREANPDFTRFSISHYAPELERYHLMAEINDNATWWVVAILTGPAEHPVIRELPQWHASDPV